MREGILRWLLPRRYVWSKKLVGGCQFNFVLIFPSVLQMYIFVNYYC